MTTKPNFTIKPVGIISNEFLNRNLSTFSEAAAFVKNLPYKRNSDKKDLTIVFKESCGTCSTKHGVLKELAVENEFEGIDLMLGIFKMNEKNTPKVSKTLLYYHLPYMPEAHNYLRFENQVLDFTHATSKPSDFLNDLIQEIAIETNQLTDFKTLYHQHYLKSWLTTEKLPYSLTEIWAVREQCIKSLSE